MDNQTKTEIYRLAEECDKVENLAIVCEECAELTQATTKIIRYMIDEPSSKAELELEKSLLEEMADVSICLEMLKQMAGITDKELEDAIACKMQRNMERHNSKMERYTYGFKNQKEESEQNTI